MVGTCSFPLSLLAHGMISSQPHGGEKKNIKGEATQFPTQKSLSCKGCFLKSLHVTLPHQNQKKLNSCTKGTQTVFMLLVQLPEECSELGHLCHHDRMLRRVGRQRHNRMNQQDYVPTSTGRDDTERVISVFNAKGQKFCGWQCFKPALFQTKVRSKERSCPKIG